MSARAVSADALRRLAELLRAEDTPIAEHVVEPPAEPELGLLAAGGERAAVAPADYALVIESVREGYLLHHGDSRLLVGHDDDLALLAGDYLYALGLERLAALGNPGAVLVLADLISDCSRLHAEGREHEVPSLWERAARSVGAGGANG